MDSYAWLQTRTIATRIKQSYGKRQCIENFLIELIDGLVLLVRLGEFGSTFLDLRLEAIPLLLQSRFDPTPHTGESIDQDAKEK